jgi:hypothetical protein
VVLPAPFGPRTGAFAGDRERHAVQRLASVRCANTRLSTAKRPGVIVGATRWH